MVILWRHWPPTIRVWILVNIIPHNRPEVRYWETGMSYQIIPCMQLSLDILYLKIHQTLHSFYGYHWTDPVTWGCFVMSSSQEMKYIEIIILKFSMQLKSAIFNIKLQSFDMIFLYISERIKRIVIRRTKQMMTTMMTNPSPTSNLSLKHHANRLVY